MDRVERAIFTNMCMVRDGQGRVLLQDRTDPNWPGVVFPGGHIEPGESFVDSVRREVREETGVEIGHVRLCGLKQFRSGEGARYVVALFIADYVGGEVTSSSEGRAFWAEESELPKFRCVRGFDEMLRVFLEPDTQELFYTYDEDGEHANWR